MECVLLLNKVQVFLTAHILAIFVWSMWMHYWQYCMRGYDALSLSGAIWWRWCDIYGAIISFEYLCLLMSFCHLMVMWSSQLSEPKHLGTMTILYVSQTFVRKEITLIIVQELCESRCGRPGLSVLMKLLVSVDVKIYWTMLRHWSQLFPNMSTDIWGH